MPSQHEPNSHSAMNENTSGPLPELKPCRLCNAIPELVSYGPVDDQGIAYCCPNKHFRTIYFASPEEAASAWNDGELVFLGRSGVSTLGYRL